MSTSSPLPSYSSPASSRAAPFYGRRSSFAGQLAFLVHSQESVANHMPPHVDNKALARQKRRRTRYVVALPLSSKVSASVPWFNARARAGTCLGTRAPGTTSAQLPRDHHHLTIHRIKQTKLTTATCSKEDEDVLKAEYLQNAKPDKAARLAIVRKVALGEKEVQVRVLRPTSRASIHTYPMY